MKEALPWFPQSTLTSRYMAAIQLQASDPEGLSRLLSMERQILDAKATKRQVSQALERLRQGDPNWIKSIQSSDHHEFARLLGLVMVDLLNKKEAA